MSQALDWRVFNGKNVCLLGNFVLMWKRWYERHWIFQRHLNYTGSLAVHSLVVCGYWLRILLYKCTVCLYTVLVYTHHHHMYSVLSCPCCTCFVWYTNAMNSTLSYVRCRLLFTRNVNVWCMAMMCEQEYTYIYIYIEWDVLVRVLYTLWLWHLTMIILLLKWLFIIMNRKQKCWYRRWSRAMRLRRQTTTHQRRSCELYGVCKSYRPSVGTNAYKAYNPI